ncbi:hypothetical protein J6590_005155 [Homalodisca vitripennis]|nr:hypothetical protein J6590_005155 [Homalodisca vitripennis]
MWTSTPHAGQDGDETCDRRRRRYITRSDLLIARVREQCQTILYLRLRDKRPWPPTTGRQHKDAMSGGTRSAFTKTLNTATAQHRRRAVHNWPGGRLDGEGQTRAAAPNREELWEHRQFPYVGLSYPCISCSCSGNLTSYGTSQIVTVGTQTVPICGAVISVHLLQL